MKRQYSTARSRTRGYRGYQSSYGRRRSGSSLAGRLAALLTGRLQKIVRFFANPAINRTAGRIALFVVPAVVVCNLLCLLLIHNADNKLVTLKATQAELDNKNIALRLERAVAWGPANMAKLAEEKLELYPPGGKRGKAGNKQYAIVE